MEFIELSNGVKMPKIGYGVYLVSKEECERCVLDALNVGYRLIDTAQSYFNEEEVGNAITKSSVPREDIFITSKVWIEHYGYEKTKQSVYTSLEKLKTEYIDLMLLHQPFADYYGAWRALEDLYTEGKIRAIGVANFYPDRLVDICSFSRIKPMVNQIETSLHNSLDREVSSIQIGELAMEKLRTLDEVAYIRFASVYRQFKDVNTFMEEISRILSEK